MRGLIQHHQLLQNILTKAAEEILHETKNSAGKRHTNQDKGKEMDREGKVASQRNERKTLHLLTKVYKIKLQQLEPLSGTNKGSFLIEKAKLSRQTTFGKQQTDRNYMKLLVLANKLPAFRKTRVKHYTEDSTTVFPKLKCISVTGMRICAAVEDQRKSCDCSAKSGGSKALQGTNKISQWEREMVWQNGKVSVSFSAN